MCNMWNNAKLYHKTEIRGTFLNSFYEATVTQIPKPHKEHYPQNYRPIYFMTTDVKVLNQILANWIQEHLKKCIHCIKLASSQRCRDGSTYKSINVIHHIYTWKGKNCMVTSLDEEKAFNKLQHSPHRPQRAEMWGT